MNKELKKGLIMENSKKISLKNQYIGSEEKIKKIQFSLKHHNFGCRECVYHRLNCPRDCKANEIYIKIEE